MKLLSFIILFLFSFASFGCLSQIFETPARTESVIINTASHLDVCNEYLNSPNDFIIQTFKLNKSVSSISIFGIVKGNPNITISFNALNGVNESLKSFRFYLKESEFQNITLNLSGTNNRPGNYVLRIICDDCKAGGGGETAPNILSKQFCLWVGKNNPYPDGNMIYFNSEFGFSDGSEDLAMEVKSMQ